MPFDSTQNHQILNHPSLALSVFILVAIKYNKVPLLGMIAFFMHFKSPFVDLFSNKFLRHKNPLKQLAGAFHFIFLKPLNKYLSHKMENSLQQERDNSLQVRILNNSSFKITSSVSIGNFYTGSPEHTTFSLNTQVFEKEHTKVNF